MSAKLEVVIITGMSGAGKTVAVHAFEDLGYFVIDNMLPALAGRFVDVIEESGEFSKTAMVMDSRSKGFYEQVAPVVKKMRERPDLAVRVLFLDASDVSIISRYKETRRAHPLAKHDGVLAGIDRNEGCCQILRAQRMSGLIPPT